MKWIVCLLAVAFVVSGCSSNKTIDGVEYETYGLLNSSEKRSADVRYELCKGNVFWGIMLSETVAAPIYFFGFDLYEPVGKRADIKGSVAR